MAGDRVKTARTSAASGFPRVARPSRGPRQLRAVATHEAGHCVSLAHNNNTSSVMYTYISSTGVTNPNSGDRNDVNRRY